MRIGPTDMVWVAFLIAAFMLIGLRRRMPSGQKHFLVFVVTSLTLGATYLTFGSG